MSWFRGISLSEILNQDIEITLWIYQWAILPNWVYLPLTLIGSVWFFFFFFFFKLVREYQKKQFITWSSLHSFLSVTIFMALSVTLKIVVGRTRPDVFFEIDPTAFYPLSFNGSYHSFISSHAAILAFMGSYQKKPFWYLLALLTGLSRIFLLCHFFFDVVCGLVWGFTWGVILHAFLSKKPSFIKNSWLQKLK
jgi:membrane-associated phospholipid phosphatase